MTISAAPYETSVKPLTDRFASPAEGPAAWAQTTALLDRISSESQAAGRLDAPAPKPTSNSVAAQIDRIVHMLNTNDTVDALDRIVRLLDRRPDLSDARVNELRYLADIGTSSLRAQGQTQDAAYYSFRLQLMEPPQPKAPALQVPPPAAPRFF